MMADSTPGEWQALVLAQRPWLQALIGRQLSEPAAVEDVLQETLTAGVEKGDESPGVVDMRAWLGGVARKKSQDHLRKRLRRERAHRRMGGEPDVAAATPLEVLIDAERHSLVRDAVGRLGRRDAELLRLKYAEGKNYTEIGAALGLSHNAVANGLREARSRFRISIAEHEAEI